LCNWDKDFILPCYKRGIVKKIKSRQGRTKEGQMNKQTLLKLVFVLPILLALLLFGADFPSTANAPSQEREPLHLEAEVGTAFTYQGQLADGSGPIDGTCDFAFALYDAATIGTQIGSDVAVNGVTVTNGSFAVQIDFGAGVFTGEARFLEVTVDCGSGPTTLSPRQELTPVPYALGLRPGATIEGTGTALTGITSGASATDAGVQGQNNGADGYGVWALGSGTSAGLRAESSSGNIIEGWDTDDPVSARFVVSNTGDVRISGGLVVAGGTDDSVTLGGSDTVLDVSTSGSGSRAISGSATGGANPAGVYGTSSSSSGRGVFGEATNTSGANSGVRGETPSTSSNATGVFGLVSSSSATGSGVKGQNNGSSGYGVWGQGGADATGVLGQTGSSDDYGVWAYNSGAGVALRAESSSGSIIEGWDIDDPVNARFVVSNTGDVHIGGGLVVAGGTDDNVTLGGSDTVLDVSTSGSGSRAISGSATGGANPAGVYGTSSSSSGRGVFGEATNTSGANSGVRGETPSTNSNATGVFGLVSSSSATGSGVKGQNNGTSGYGVWGQGGSDATGVLGQTNSSSDYGVWAYNFGTGVALRAEGSGNLIEAWDLSPVNVRFRVDNNGNVTADGTYTSPAADFAEMLPAARDLEPGDVLVVGPDGKLARSSAAYQTTVVGVYSTKPAFLGGATEGIQTLDQVPLAIVGIVPVKVSAENGAIQPGDLLVASNTPGHAMRAGELPATGTVIGKALSGLETGTGTIQMLVTLQ
jgi:hypothetical protein